MIFWGMAFLLFGAVALESGEWWPLVVVVVAMMIVSPTQRKLESEAGDPYPLVVVIVIVVAFGLPILAILSNWRG